MRAAIDSAQPARDAMHIRVCDRQEGDTAGSASGCMSSNCFRYAHSNPPEYHIVHQHMLPWFEYQHLLLTDLPSSFVNLEATDLRFCIRLSHADVPTSWPRLHHDIFCSPMLRASHTGRIHHNELTGTGRRGSDTLAPSKLP